MPESSALLARYVGGVAFYGWIFLLVSAADVSRGVGAEILDNVPKTNVTFGFLNQLMEHPTINTWFEVRADRDSGSLEKLYVVQPFRSSHLGAVDYYRVTGRQPSAFVGIGSLIQPAQRGFRLVRSDSIEVDRSVRLNLLKSEWRREMYRLLVRLAAVQSSIQIIRDDLKLIDLSLTASERKYGLKDLSHLELMHLQNIRTLQDSQMVIHTNDLSLFELEIGELTRNLVKPPIPKLALPRHIVLSPKTLSLLMDRCTDGPFPDLTGSVEDRQSDLRSTQREHDGNGRGRNPGIVRQSYVLEARRDIRRLGHLINSAAIRYSAFSDEIQLRNQEAVATAAAEMELGRADVGSVIMQRRKLLADRMEMVRLILIQHEALADVLYLTRVGSLDEILQPRKPAKQITEDE